MKAKREGMVLQQAKEGAVGADVPAWIQVLPAGQVLIRDGDPAIMDDEAAAMVMEQYKAASNDMVVDYEHQTLSGNQAPAAGWVKELEWRPGDGLYARVAWTEQAAAYIAKREYRYLSPVFYRRLSDNRVSELYNIALTNQPRMLNVAQIVAAKQIPNPNPNPDGGNPMLEKLKKFLGLAAESGDPEVCKAVEAMVAKNKELEAKVAAGEGLVPVACKEVMDVLGLKPEAAKADAVQALEALKSQAKAVADGSGDMAKELANVKGELSAMKAEGLIQQALKDGKTSPAELDAWGRKMARETPDTFAVVVLKREPGSVVPVQDMPARKDAPGADGATDPAQLEVNKQLGIDAETWAKHGPKEA